MKRVNFEALQKMLADGMQQTEIAKHFGVSDAAITKAKRRLKALALPPSLERLTEKEKKYVLNRASGMNKAKATRFSYDCDNLDSAKSLGYKLSKDPDIQLALADLMAQEEISRRRRIQRLRDLVESKDLTQ